MNISDEKTPVLVIEDNEDHFNAIKNKFGGEKYEFENFREFSNDRLLNYKALKQENQIVIVDLQLQGKKDQGIDIIRRYLLPADPTTFFIIFTQFPEKMNEVSLVEVNPHWTFVPKEFLKSKSKSKEGKLSQNCLNHLYKVVEEFRKYCTPSLWPPRYTTHTHLEQMEQFFRDNHDEALMKRFKKVMWSAIVRSIDFLNDVSSAAATFNRSGMLSLNTGIGIYGSCGRLEARTDSDIEFSVFYYEGDDPGKTKELAVIFWNRLMKYMQNLDWEVEGAKALQENEPPILRLKQVSSNLPNEYRPVISINSIVDKNFQKSPQIRDRHLQILTELKPVFNPNLLIDLKKSLIKQGLGQTPENIADLIGSDYIPEIMTQFFLDSRPSKLSTFKDYKSFCYRVLHLLSLRICLIQKLQFEERSLKNDEKWIEFFDSLSSPGIYKVMRFYIYCLHKISNEKSKGKDTLIKLLYRLLVAYIEILERFWEAAESQQRKKKIDYRDFILPNVRSCVNHFVDVLKQLESMTFFASSQTHPWLFDTNEIERFLNKL